MADKELRAIFKNGSKTYFYSTMFFPREVKEDVFKLYAFVRTADDLVDSIPQRGRELEAMKARFHAALAGRETDDIVVSSFVELFKRKGFKKEWVDAFLCSMEMDLSTASYETMDDLATYLYGSAEVVGLMMARIMDLPQEAYPYARLLGRAMQYINFIRDIDEDNSMGRSYFPREELRRFGLDDLREGTVRADPARFRRFARAQLRTYKEWQNEAEEGYQYIPRRYLVPIKTAADMYKFTATSIYSRPLQVFHKKIKPSVGRIVFGYSKNRICPLIKRPAPTPLGPDSDC